MTGNKAIKEKSYMLLSIRITELEKKELKKQANNLGLRLSDYVKCKLFNENEDLEDKETRYVSPHIDKNNLLMVTMLCKISYFIMELLEKQGYSAQEIKLLESEALEYARNQREKHGYRIIINKDS